MSSAVIDRHGDAVVRTRGGATVRRTGRLGRRRMWFGIAFVTPYVIFLLAIGIAPAMSAIYEAFVDHRGQTGALGLQNFRFVFSDFRFWPAVGHVGTFMLIWIPVMVVGTLALALLLHERVGRSTTLLRLVYYLPAAVAGSAAVMLWYFMLVPQLSPFGPVLQLLGFHSTVDMFTSGNLPWIFALLAFATGAGGWIVIIFGAFQSLPIEVMESARVDGAGPVRVAWSIKLPLIRKYVLYMMILSFAAATQIFVEPALIASIEPSAASPWWSLNQLASLYAFNEGDFGSAAVLSLLLLIISAVAAAVLIFGTDLFQTEVDDK
jgi:multiple sugar transport system permease protein